MHIHLVFATKYRRYVFTKQILDALKIIFPSVCNDFEADLVEFDGEKYHVHLLITYPPKVSISRSVNSLKGVSGRLIRKKKYPSIPSMLWGGEMLSGLLLILLQVVGVHLFLLSNSTLNNRIRLTEKIIIFDPYMGLLQNSLFLRGIFTALLLLTKSILYKNYPVDLKANRGNRTPCMLW